ncbi:mitochondrial Complex I (CI) NADH:ubiquinone oxidoreductase subunit AGGG/NIGM/NDUFB2 [Andalucia godoyi]|uniref:Mitochondrial Complex I (CI) NADH:ubiquinone oxidoreductase subunit AGGG/NIGM/NDUFB2 n=1 Tax=Andalucia godoyi TaxID=505711 RepID=A0A8K0F2R9_ANDGO|nr:mitochondrial Complex I (CI) NADH:ubiquinone oxidoreductase subunit AGGG/NIGM/NDUFB2 [Andalucia godoyi]|eukprot:ANDGO_08132.mRNA.1 mitochondrial Complex I (CI) NADH:ubiquinone oxidoreductase subunit AGGG/NIGM/NDUFB2
MLRHLFSRSSSALRSSRMFTRGDHSHSHSHSSSARAGEFEAPHVSDWHVVGGKAFGAMMWFWVFYRAYHDGAATFGFKPPFENHGHGDEHGHGSGHH